MFAYKTFIDKKFLKTPVITCDFVQPAAALEVDLGASFLTREVDLLGSFLSSRG